MRRLDALAEAWHEIAPTARVRQAGIRVLRVHPLRFADALQLGAAIVASEGSPPSLPVITFDTRLAEAVEREGFRAIVPH